MFEASVTGRLTFVATIKEGDPGVVDALNGATFSTLSSDGRHLYLAARSDDALLNSSPPLCRRPVPLEALGGFGF